MIIFTHFFVKLSKRFRGALAVSRSCLKLIQAGLGNPASFTHFCEKNFAVWHAAQAFNEAEFGKRPDRPFRWIPLPRLHTVAVVVLELVMIVVVAFAKGKKRHDCAVSGGMFGGIRLFTNGVAKGIDEKRAMLGDHDAGHTSDEETTEGTLHRIQTHQRIVAVTK